jgi:hypothetical protein
MSLFPPLASLNSLPRKRETQRRAKAVFRVFAEPAKIHLEVSMKHDEAKPAITPELEAEFQTAVRQAMSLKRDPEAMRKAAERIDRMREETFRQHGLLDFGVAAIRELRGELLVPVTILLE